MKLHVAKVLQALGLGVTAYALLVGLTEAHSMGPELKLLGLGVLLFYGGRVVEKRTAAS